MKSMKERTNDLTAKALWNLDCVKRLLPWLLSPHRPVGPSFTRVARGGGTSERNRGFARCFWVLVCISRQSLVFDTAEKYQVG